jgi:hypothetical protein
VCDTCWQLSIVLQACLHTAGLGVSAATSVTFSCDVFMGFNVLMKSTQHSSSKHVHVDADDSCIRPSLTVQCCCGVGWSRLGVGPAAKVAVADRACALFNIHGGQ